MKNYLEVTFRAGRPIAAYLYLPRSPGDKSVRTRKADPGLIIDFNEAGMPIGVEITAPPLVPVNALNLVLLELGVATVDEEDLAPLQAA